jgi:phosphatidylserine/phosphatidylglycerophosphate/cardiolipin synthase-like enzyme
MRAYFLRPNADNLAEEKLIELFKDYKELYIAVAYFNNKKFSNLLINRADNHFPTNLLINTSDILRPQNDGDSEIAISEALMKVIVASSKGLINVRSLGTRAKGKYQNMHHKFYMNSDKLFFGSVNLTDAALNRNYELLTETYDKHIIENFKNEFNSMWKIASEIYTGRDNKLRSLMCPICERHEGVDFESYGPICTFCGHKFSLK